MFSFDYQVEINMHAFLSILALMMFAASALAADATIPEPDVLSLIGIGAVAYLATRRRKQ